MEELDVKSLTKEWQRNQPHLSEKDWLKIFPEAKPIIELKIKEYKSQYQTLKLEIEKDLRKGYTQITDEFSIWFWEKYLEVFKGEKLEELTKNINRLTSALAPKPSQCTITKEMIQRAKEYPFENLIEFNRAKKTLCVFHNEVHPSLSLNPRTNRVKCFGYGINLDTIEYIIKTQNFSFVEAVKYLTNH